MGAAYSDQSGLPVWHLDAVAAGEPVHTRWDPMTYSPIHDDDICAQLEPLLDAATVPATIVNWAGDEPVSVQEYSAFFGELLGVRGRRSSSTEIPGASRRFRRRPHQAQRRSPDRARSAGATGSGASPSTSIPIGCGADVADRYPDADSLLADARASTGLDDFGPGDFRDGLDVLLESFERDTDLSPATRRAAWSTTSAVAW